MLDLSYFQNQNSNVQGFFNGGTWSTWIKPRGAKLVNFLVVGGAAGGGGGLQSALTTITGGSAGGNGGIVRGTFIASVLPDILYIYIGQGGIGGIGGSSPTAGGNGQTSFVCLIPDSTSISNIVLRSGNIVAQGGGAGSTVSVTGGAGETIATVANSIFWNLGTVLAQAGSVGSNSSQTIVASVFTPGCGGGGITAGTPTLGGRVTTATFPFFTVPAVAVGANGRTGIVIYNPAFFVYGGSGGAGSLTTAGNGGDGLLGCSGGGAGSGNTSGGNGGRGGDGFAIITTSL